MAARRLRVGERLLGFEVISVKQLADSFGLGLQQAPFGTYGRLRAGSGKPEVGRDEGLNSRVSSRSSDEPGVDCQDATERDLPQHKPPHTHFLLASLVSLRAKMYALRLWYSTSGA